MKFIKISTLRSFVDLNAAICRGASCSLPLARRDAHTVSLPLSLLLSPDLGQVVCAFLRCASAQRLFTPSHVTHTQRLPKHPLIVHCCHRPQAAGRGLSVRSLIAAGQRYRDIVIDDCTVQVVQMRNASLCVLHKTLLASVISCTFDCAPATRDALRCVNRIDNRSPM